MSASIQRYFAELGDSFPSLPWKDIEAAKEILKEARNRARIWLVGNGGSAATAIHFANDLQKVCGFDVMPLPALISTVTAYGNDNGWVNMFSDAMKNFVRKDVLVAFSFSGASSNIIRAAEHASLLDSKIIVLTGPMWDRNYLGQMKDICLISVQNASIAQVEDIHLAICHALVVAIRKEIEE